MFAIHAELPAAEIMRLQAVFDLSTIGIANGGADGRILRANAALIRFLGYPLATLQTLTFGDLTHPDDLPTSDESFRVLVDMIRTASSLDTLASPQCVSARVGLLVRSPSRAPLARG